MAFAIFTNWRNPKVVGGRVDGRMHADSFDLFPDEPRLACYIADRATLEAAVTLMSDHGHLAGIEAAARADASRARGNVNGFCRWRQIERLIETLSAPRDGTLH